jgi:hypothetical protein
MERCSIVMLLVLAVTIVSSSGCGFPQSHSYCNQPLQFYIDYYDNDNGIDGSSSPTTYVVDVVPHHELFGHHYTELHWSPEYVKGIDRRLVQQQSKEPWEVDGDTDAFECHYHGYAWRSNDTSSAHDVLKGRSTAMRSSSFMNVAISTRGSSMTITDIHGMMYIEHVDAHAPLQAFMLHPLPPSTSSATERVQMFDADSLSSEVFTTASLMDADERLQRNHYQRVQRGWSLRGLHASTNHQYEELSWRHHFTPFSLHGNDNDPEDNQLCALKYTMQSMLNAAAATKIAVAATDDDMTTEATTDTRTRYVELLLVNDHLRYLNLTTATEYDTAAIANMANLLYSTMTTPPVKLVLVAQITFVAVDPYTVTVSNTATGSVTIDDLLSSFQQWRAYQGAALAPHDAGHLLTGHILDDGIVGLATLAGMCVATVSGGVEQSLNGQSLVYTAVAVAHELGHNFGMIHDGQGSGETTCSSSGAVMAPSFCRNCELSTFAFSSCSVAALQSFVTTTQASCLDNVPTRSWNDSNSGICGDGVVNVGEACDCGGNTTAACIASGDTCCNPVTCQLLPGAACSLRDVCCRSCQIITAANHTGTLLFSLRH